MNQKSKANLIDNNNNDDDNDNTSLAMGLGESFQRRLNLAMRFEDGFAGEFQCKSLASGEGRP